MILFTYTIPNANAETGKLFFKARREVIGRDSEVTIMRAGDDNSEAELHHTESVASDSEVEYIMQQKVIKQCGLLLSLTYMRMKSH